MKFTKTLPQTAFILTAGFLVPQLVQAGGIDLYEVSTPDVGLASAGYAAGAQDASTLFKNPAGMSRLNGPRLNASLQVLYGNVQFSVNAKTTSGGASDQVRCMAAGLTGREHDL